MTGGLSGPAIKPIALAKVYEVAQSVKIPIIGIGGISSWEDAVEFLLVGASAIEVGTQNYVNPASTLAIARGIADYAKAQGVSDVGEFVGTLDAKLEFSPIKKPEAGGEECYDRRGFMLGGFKGRRGARLIM